MVGVEPHDVSVEKSGPERSFREEQLVEWGEHVGRRVRPPLWVALCGPLGAGKTVLVRSICRGAGIEGRIVSPSFTLVQEYQSPRGFPIHHVDLYRIRAGDTLEPLGWDHLLRSPGLVLVEWADRAGRHQPNDRWEILMDYGSRANERVVHLRRIGKPVELPIW